MNRNIKKLISSLNREKVIVTNASSLVILQISQFLFPLIIMPYLIRTLGLANYGVLIFSQTIANYFVMVTNYGFYLSAPREISLHRENIKKRNEITSSIFIIKSILMILCFLIMLFFVVFINPFKQNSLVFLTSMLLVVTEVVFPRWFFQGIEEMGNITILNIIGRSMSVIVMFFIVTGPEHLIRAAFVQTLGGLIAGIISMIFLFTKYKYKFVYVKYRDLVHMLVEGWNLFVSQLSTVLFQNINVTLLGLLATPEAVGIYSSGEKVVRVAVSLVNPICSAIYPNISKLLYDFREKAILKLRVILKAGVLFFALISLLLFFSSELIAKLLVGNANNEIAIVIKILCLLPVFVFVNNIYGTQYMINSRMVREFRNIIVFSGFTLVLTSYIFVHFIGIIGAATALFLSEFLLVLLMAYHVEYKSKSYTGLLRLNKKVQHE